MLAPAAADARYRCPGVPGFSCARVGVPLDRTGTVPGRLGIRYAIPNGTAGRDRALVALTGGPGQPGVLFGPSYKAGFGGLLRGRTLVVVDQRGTGGSHALDCPEIQGLDSVEPIFPDDVAGCAARLGPSRNSFSSLDSADDLEAIRRHLGVERLAIYGVSYGTVVAQQYARRYPNRVERLILDSPVPPRSDPWDLQIPQALPRVLRHLCAGRACAGITEDPVADLDAVVRMVQEEGRLSGTVRTPSGGRQREHLTQVDLLYVLVSSDLNAFMQSRIPAALVAARRGDPVPLLRLRRDAAGPTTPLSQFSGGLFVTTTCLDNELPYSYADPVSERAEKSAAALAAIPAEAFAPFDRSSIDVSSVPQICLRWPDGAFRPPTKAPLPDVPTLILSGLTDLRTPVEGARMLLEEVPEADLLTLAGAGHDLFDTDTTGCVNTAIRRFFGDREVGTPCARRSLRSRLAAVPPRTLAGVAPVPGLPDLTGRVLRAAVDTVADAVTSDNQAWYAGFDRTGRGGLRGGLYRSYPTAGGQYLSLIGYEYVDGVAVSGTVVADGSELYGEARLTAPDGRRSRFSFFGGRVVGRIGGRTVKATIRHLVRTRAPRTDPPALAPSLRRR